MDAGGALTRANFNREIVDNTNIQGMVEMGCAASTIAVRDLYRGVDYLLERFSQNGLPLVSANVYDKETGDYLVRPYVVVERGGVRIGITGVTVPDQKIATEKGISVENVRLDDPAESLGRTLPELRGKCDFIVVLAQMSLGLCKELPERVEGMDFLVVGAHSGYSAKPYEIGGTVFMQPGARGQYISDYRLHFNGEGGYEGYSGESLVLGESVPSDAAMALRVKEHKMAVDRLNKQRAAEQRAESRGLEKAARKPEGPDCVGFKNSCARCHDEQTRHWMTTAHAHAFETLEKATQSTNPECLKCHSTCYTDLPADGSVQVNTDLRSVQCESCHGSGAGHARDGSFGGVSKSTCLVCHDPKNSPDFNYVTYLAAVKHSSE